MGRLTVDVLWRRPPGPRLLVYLDQSALSRLAAGAQPRLLELLRNGRVAGRLVCPQSAEHRYETVLTSDDTVFRAISELSDELSMGVGFLAAEDVWQEEVHAAAAAFTGVQPTAQVWQEAFETDPHAPLEALFPVRGLRVSVEPEKAEWLEEEAAHEKDLSVRMQAAWDSGVAASFAVQAEAALVEMIKWKLFPLVDRKGYAAWVREIENESLRELAVSEDFTRTGSAFNRYSHRRHLGTFAESLLRAYPGLRGREQAFVRSDHVRNVPSFRYPTLLMAGLCCITGRKAKPGDLYDIQHLTQGLSRCDIATADGGMTQLCRQYGLVPSAVRLFSSRELQDLTAHLDSVLK